MKDVFPDSVEVLLRFERDWQPESRFPVARVRLPPPAPASGAAAEAFKEGDEIEVFSRASDQVNLQLSLQESCYQKLKEGTFEEIVKVE